MTTPIPHLPVSDGEAAIRFYEKAFGASLVQKMPGPDGKRLMHAELKLGEGKLLLHDEFPEHSMMGGAKAPTTLGGASCTIHLDFPDADVAFAQAIAAGATEILPLANQFWGMRYGQLKDPFGHVWSLGGPVK
jgi:PhnB protein